MCKVRGSDDSDYDSNTDAMLSVRNLPVVELGVFYLFGYWVRLGPPRLW